MHKRLITGSLVAASLVCAGCSADSSSLITGSLFGSKEASAVAAGPTETPSMRAAQVSAVSARAAKCGYNFDPTRLKSNFLAAESAKGASVQDMAKIEKEFDTIRAKVADTITADADFCSDQRTRTIKADLTRHMAGDFSLGVENKKIDERLLANVPRTREVLNREFLLDRNAPKTKRIEE